MSSLLEILLAVTIGLNISEMIFVVVMGWLIASIFIYLVVKHFNSDVSFEKVFGATILAEIVSAIIILTLDFLTFPFITSTGYLSNLFWIIWRIEVIMAFIAVVSIYKKALNVGLGASFSISIAAIILYYILLEVAMINVTAGDKIIINTPVGTMGIDIYEIIIYFMFGLFLSTIFTYFVAKHLNVNISFLRTPIFNTLLGILSFIIVVISVLTLTLVKNNVLFYMAACVGIAFMLVLIIYKGILNISWKKAILLSIIVNVLWFVIGLLILPNYIHFMICC